MIVACREGKDLPCSPLDDLRGRPSFLGRALRQQLIEDLPELALPGILTGQPLDPLHHKLGSLARKIKHQLGRHPQTTCRPRA